MNEQNLFKTRTHEIDLLLLLFLVILFDSSSYKIEQEH